MTTDKNLPRGASSHHDYDALVPDELLAANHRRAASRARTSRTLHRSKLRRRVLPTVVVTSVAIVGSGLANAFVGATVPAVTTTTTSSVPAYVSRQNTLNAKTLARLSATLANDRRIVSALSSTAQNTSSTASSLTAAISAISARLASSVGASTTTPTSGGSSPSGTPSATTVTRRTTGGSSSGATTATTATPTTASPAPVTTTTAVPVVVPTTVATPPTHTTTGASGAG